jgi:hypothetical protein
MRPVLPADLDGCARALMHVPAPLRPGRIADIIRAADIADRFRKRTGRLHTAYGDGSLGSAAWRVGQVPRPPRCDADYCLCLSVVLDGLEHWRSRLSCDPKPAKEAALHWKPVGEGQEGGPMDQTLARG